MATDQLAMLVHRALNDPSFLERARADLDGTLAAEGFTLSREELDAVRAFQAEAAGASPAEVQRRLTDTTRRQGAM